MVCHTFGQVLDEVGGHTYLAHLLLIRISACLETGLLGLILARHVALQLAAGLVVLRGLPNGGVWHGLD